MFENYLQQIGLGDLVKDIKKTKLNNFVEDAFALDFPALSAKEIKNLYVYNIPKISPDGSCSILEEKNDKPYNLAQTFRLTSFLYPEQSEESHSKNDLRFKIEDLRERDSSARPQNDEKIFSSLSNNPHTIRLWRLKWLVEKLFDETGVDWLGIYRKIKNPKGELVLVKESYLGVFSRPEFPLTKEFAKKSNNSTVGLTGKAIVIQDVFTHKGAYYKCDGKVQSEFCVPILSPMNHELRTNNNVLGIIDAEAFPKNFYSTEKLLQIAKVAFDLGKVLGVY